MKKHILLLLVITMSTVGYAVPTQQRNNAQAAPPDPSEDVLGWENGVWHNESVAIDQSDGLNDSELKAFVNRTMARVELVRELEFEEDVPVEITSREEFQNRQFGRSASEEFRMFDNVKFEALLMINESTDSLAVQEQNTGASILGFYNPESDRIVLISEGGESPRIDEITLAHELMHAMQDQKWDLTSSQFNQRTREKANTVAGIVEGDPELLEVLYQQRCGELWGSCSTPERMDGSSDLANIGPFILKFQPRSDGPGFVQDVRQEGGWEAVNELYTNLPRSTEQLIHPDKFGEDEPTNVTVRDKSTDDWEQLRVDQRPDTMTLGEAGVFSMFLFPSFDTGGQTEIIPASHFRNTTESGELQPIDGLNYNHPLSAGWDGDTLVPYTSSDGEKGYVWKLAWDSEQEATEFVEGYRQLLDARGAEQVDDRQNTYRIPEGEEFADAFYVIQQDDTVIIVNAPTVEELSGVYAGAAPAAE